MKKLVIVILFIFGFFLYYQDSAKAANRAEIVNNVRTFANHSSTVINLSSQQSASSSHVGSPLPTNLQEKINKNMQYIQSLKQRLQSLHNLNP